MPYDFVPTPRNIFEIRKAVEQTPFRLFCSAHTCKLLPSDIIGSPKNPHFFRNMKIQHL